MVDEIDQNFDELLQSSHWLQRRLHEGGAKSPEMINKEVGINVESFFKKQVNKCKKREVEGGKI